MKEDNLIELAFQNIHFLEIDYFSNPSNYKQLKKNVKHELVLFYNSIIDIVDKNTTMKLIESNTLENEVKNEK